MEKDMKKINGIKRARVMNYIIVGIAPINLVAWYLYSRVKWTVSAAAQGVSGLSSEMADGLLGAMMMDKNRSSEFLMQYAMASTIVLMTVLLLGVAGIVAVIFNALIDHEVAGKKIGIVGSCIAISSMLLSPMSGVGPFLSLVLIPLFLYANKVLKEALTEPVVEVNADNLL